MFFSTSFSTVSTCLFFSRFPFCSYIYLNLFIPVMYTFIYFIYKLIPIFIFTLILVLISVWSANASKACNKLPVTKSGSVKCIRKRWHVARWPLGTPRGTKYKCIAQARQEHRRNSAETTHQRRRCSGDTEYVFPHRTRGGTITNQEKRQSLLPNSKCQLSVCVCIKVKP